MSLEKDVGPASFPPPDPEKAGTFRLTTKGKRLAAGLRANGGMPVKGEST